MQFHRLKRRDFMTLLGGAAACPLAARAQQPGKPPIIGILGSNTPSTQGHRFAAFVQRLDELGWVEKRTVAIEYRWAEGRRERLAEIAAEFVRLKVDVIVTAGTPVVMAVKQATTAIPIVFAVSTDPVGSGLVASLARPGGNVTGLSVQSPEIATKRLALLREVLPNLRRVAFLGNIDNAFVLRELREIEAAGETLGLETALLEIRHAQDIGPAFVALKHRGAQALYLASEGLVDDHRLRINILALGARVPTMWNNKHHVEAGGLMSYGPDIEDQYRRAANVVDKILRGTRPADIPVEQPVKFDLVVNLIVAEALGLTMPPTLLARADEVIE